MSMHDQKCELGRTNLLGRITHCWCAIRADYCDAEADERRFRAELRDRLDRCTDSDHGAAFGWLTDNHPDLVREALDETGAPS